jgi:hypothetical protein
MNNGVTASSQTAPNRFNARYRSCRGRIETPAGIAPNGCFTARVVRVCAEFQGIGLANRFELVYLDRPGVAIYGSGASLVRMPAHGPFPRLDAVSWPRTQNRIKLRSNTIFHPSEVRMSHASMLRARRKHQKTKKLLDLAAKQAKRLAKQALAGPAVKKEKVKKERVKKEKVETEKKEKKVKLTKEELGRQDAKKSSAGAGKKGAS